MVERVTKVRLVADVTDYEKGMLAAARATQSVGSENEKLAQKRQAFEQMGRGLVVTGAALTAVTALSVKAAMDWESAWAGVTKTVDGSDAELAKVEQGLRDLTSVLPASHAEIAAVAEAAGQLGIETPNVVAFTRTMIDLGETTNLSANDAATALARFTNIMGTSQDEVSNLGSALVGLGNNYATTESEILEMSMRLAGAGKQIGLTEGDVLGLATALSSVGIEAEAGGSAMSKVMIDIASSVENGGERLELFAKTAGVSADTFAQKWRTDPAAALSLFVKGLAGAESQGTSTLGVLSELGITEVRMRDALLRSASAADQFSDAMADGNQAFEENNALTLEAAKRYETVESKLAIAGNAVRDAAIDFGGVFLPAVAGAAEAVTEFASFMGDLPDPVQGVVGVLTAAVGVIALTGGTALLAVPKIAEFKVGMQTLGISMRTVGIVGGAAIGALTALITVVGLVASAQAEARAKAEAYADTLAEGTNKVTKATRDAVKEQLALDRTLLFMNYGSAYDNAEKLGISYELLTEAALGVPDALKELDAQIRAGEDGTQAYADAAYEITDAVKGEAGSIAEAIRMAEQKQKADGNSAESSKTAADAYTEEADTVAGLNSELSKLIDTFNEANGVGQDAVSQNIAYQDALADAEEQIRNITDGVEGYGAGLDLTTQAGRDNLEMLNGLASQSQDTAAAQFALDGSTEAYMQRMAEGRQRLYDSAIAMGATQEEAQRLADDIYAIPSEKDIQILADTSQAHERLAVLRQAMDAVKSFSVIIGATGGAAANAAGGLYVGGMKAFAGGGVEPGIYPYRAGGLHKFAEEYDEAYLSMDPKRKNRTYGVWQQVGQQFGFAQQPQPVAQPSVTAQIDMVVRDTDPRVAARRFGREFTNAIGAR